MNRPLIVPNYLHIGFSKAASTWFQDFLRKQKDVFLVYKSDFFFPLHNTQYKKGINYYSTFFKGADGYKIKIESHEHILLPFHHPRFKCASTNLDVVEMMAKRIKRILPGIKVVIIIRNQIDMLISRYCQYIIQGGKAKASEFLNQLVFAENNYKRFMDYRYAKIINLLYTILGKSNVLVLFQEELNKHPRLFIKSLSEYFKHNFTYSRQQFKKKKNIAPSLWGIQTIRSLNQLFVREVETLESRTKTCIPWHSWYLLINGIRYVNRFIRFKDKSRKLFVSDDLQKIREIFAGDNLKLSKMFEKPLLEYGYFFENKN